MGWVGVGEVGGWRVHGVVVWGGVGGWRVHGVGGWVAVGWLVGGHDRWVCQVGMLGVGMTGG